MKLPITLSLVGLLSLQACATARPPDELLQARAAMQRAQQGPASRYALVDLHTAQQSLASAEQAYASSPRSPEVRDLSYVALRRAELAGVRGETAEAVARQSELDAQRQQAVAQNLVNTQAALATARAEQSQTREQLERERLARADAERRANAAMESLRRVAAVREEQRGTVITLSGEVLFASGESVLLPIAQQRLDEVAAALQAQGSRHLVVEGHTDARGNPADNERLSLARAHAVRNYLVTRGIDASTITAVGAGASRPVADNTTAEGRANNRRVEIVVSPSNETRNATAPTEHPPVASR